MLSYLVTHYYHSGFSVACEDTMLIFDYWLGEGEELAEQYRVTPETLRSYKQIYVFISHDHPDHMDPVVFTWKDVPGIQYIVSSDMPVGTRGRRMAPGDVIRFSDDVEVSAFDSTDLGVSFLVDFKGLQVFHAGDLNFWHWREESTMQEIEEADAEFRKAVQPISKEKIDVAFFPVDPRQGAMFDAGANYFILTAKPRILIPMHYFHRTDTALDYARTASCRTTEVIALPGYGDRIRIQTDDEGYLNVSFPSGGESAGKDASEADSRDVPADGADIPPENGDSLLSEDDPFLESDLPLTSLADDESDAPEA